MSKPLYAQPYQSPHKLLKILKQRNIVIDNKEAALRFISQVGFYRLKSYAHPFKDLHYRGANAAIYNTNQVINHINTLISNLNTLLASYGVLHSDESTHKFTLTIIDTKLNYVSEIDASHNAFHDTYIEQINTTNAQLETELNNFLLGLLKEFTHSIDDHTTMYTGNLITLHKKIHSTLQQLYNKINNFNAIYHRDYQPYLPGLHFSHIIKLYDFDQQLNRILIDGLSELEINLRAALADVLGRNDPLAYTEVAIIQSHDIPKMQKYYHWIDEFHSTWKRLSDSREKERTGLETEFTNNYQGLPPIWVAVEYMTFGDITTLLELVSKKYVTKIASAWGINPHDLVSWGNSLRIVRNNCTHQQRLWNRTYPLVPSLHTRSTKLDHLSLMAHKKHYLYYRLAILKYLLDAIDPHYAQEWTQELIDCIDELPACPLMHDNQLIISEEKMGFPRDWRSYDLWQTQNLCDCKTTKIHPSTTHHYHPHTMTG